MATRPVLIRDTHINGVDREKGYILHDEDVKWLAEKAPHQTRHTVAAPDGDHMHATVHGDRKAAGLLGQPTDEQEKASKPPSGIEAEVVPADAP